MRTTGALAGVVALAACTDEVCVECICVDDVCAYPEETRSFVGPCRSRIREPRGSLSGTLDGSFAYDADSVFMVSTLDVMVDSLTGPRPLWLAERVQWTEADGVVTAISGDFLRMTGAQIFSHGATFTYDPAQFRLTAMPGRALRLSPRSDLGLLTIRGGLGQDLGTFTNERVEQTVTRTEQRGSLTVMKLDDRDRVVEATHYPDAVSPATSAAIFQYRDDLLIRHTVSASALEESTEKRYMYDLGGNIILEETLTWSPALGALDVTEREAFSYECWE